MGDVRNNCNTHIAKYLDKQKQPVNEIWSVNRIKHEEYFLEKSNAKCAEKTSPRYFHKKSNLSISLDQYLSFFIFYVKL